jgi:hypothetical protein
MSDRHKYLLALLIPTLALAVSIVRTPHAFLVAHVATDIDPLVSKPTLLYRRGNTTYFYTSDDLLYPQRYGRPGQYFQALVFDVYPVNEGHATPIETLTWVHNIGVALRSVGRGHSADRDLADRFERSFSRPPSLERGKLALFPIPAQSAFHKSSGLRLLIAIAVKDPQELDERDASTGIAPLFGPALKSAFQELDRRGITGVGVPLMLIPEKIGLSVSRAKAWETILSTVDEIAPATGSSTIVLGGYGVVPASRRKTDEAFRQAWTSWSETLKRDQDLPVDDKIRLSALAGFGALIAAAKHGKAFTLARLAALLIIAASLASAASAALEWAVPLAPSALGGNLGFYAKAFLAILAGVFIDRLVRFDAKSLLNDSAIN